MYISKVKFDGTNQELDLLSIGSPHYNLLHPLASEYTAQALYYTRTRVGLTPTLLPSGSSVYGFDDWYPDPEKLEDYGAECSVLNAHLEHVFGLRNGDRILLVERGPGIKSIVPLFTKYLTGEFTEQAVIAKWLDNLIDAAEHAASAATPAKRTAKPSAAQKCSNEWQQEDNKEKVQRKRKKTETVEKANKRAANIAKTAQSVNWNFDDLEDIAEEKVYETGRKGYPIVDKIVIACKSIETGNRRWRCSADGCKQSWASRQPQRLFAHSVQECCFIDEKLRERVADECATLAPGNKVAKLDAAKAQKRSATQSAGSQSQPSVTSLAVSEGRKAKQMRFDLAVLNFVSAAQLAPFKLDLPEFHAMIAEANSNLEPKSSGYVASCQIPMESARLRRLSVQELRNCKNLTISFDGGSTRRPHSFTTIHVTTPDTRIPYLMEAPEASGVSHTGLFYFKEVEKVLVEIGPLAFSGVTCDSAANARVAREMIQDKYPTILVLPDPCHTLHNGVKDICRLEYFSESKQNMQKVWGYFSRSPYGSAHLNGAQTKKGITQALQKPGKTRFGGWHYASNSVEINLPAVEGIVQNGVIDVKKDHKLYFMRNIVTYAKFKVEVHELAVVTKPFARAIKCLESGHSNLGDVFLFTLGLMASLRQLADNNDTELGLPSGVMRSIENIANARYHSMVLATGQEAYVSTFFLNPQYRNSDILQQNHLNPLQAGVIFIRPQMSMASPEEAELTRLFPCFPRMGLFLKQTFCRELTAGTIVAAKDFSDDANGVNQLVQAFKSQFGAYARGDYPFILPSPLPANFHPLTFWTEKENHPSANLLAPIAMKLFSVVPNSMAEERTVSNFTKLNSNDRSRQKVSTLVHMTRIRQELLRKRVAKKPVIRPVLKFCDLSSTLLKQNVSPTAGTNRAERSYTGDLPKGWTSEDMENGESNPKGPAVDDSDAGSDSGDEGADDLPDLTGCDSTVESVLGVNLSSRVLQDLLADRAQLLDSSGPARSASTSNGAGTSSSVKKDTSQVDLNSY